MPCWAYKAHMRRTRTLLASLLALGALLAMPAAAKEGVRAKLDSPVRLDAAPGTKVRVAWRLVDKAGRPFGAGGIYLRVTRCGGGLRRVPATETPRRRGRYSARFTVPKGGIRMLRVGLEGIRTTGGRTERADVVFEFDPPLTRTCP